ncbi:hypothetical protein [Tsukamurella soli]
MPVVDVDVTFRVTLQQPTIEQLDAVLRWAATTGAGASLDASHSGTATVDLARTVQTAADGASGGGGAGGDGAIGLAARELGLRLPVVVGGRLRPADLSAAAFPAIDATLAAVLTRQPPSSGVPAT